MTMSSRFRSALRGFPAVCAVAAASMLYASCALAGEAEALPYRIQWPAGWDVSLLASPPTDSGRKLGGGRVRAVHSENGAFAAAIELTYLPRSDHGQANLDEEFQGVVAGVQTGYGKMDLKVSVQPPQPTKIGKHPATFSEISASGVVSGQEVQLRQWIGMAFSPAYVYSLSYSAMGPNFSRFRKDFDAVSQGLQLR